MTLASVGSQQLRTLQVHGARVLVYRVVRTIAARSMGVNEFLPALTT